jgi:hypothetical protein
VVFERLRAALREAVAEESSRQELLKAVAKLEANHGGKGFVEAYKEFITLAAAHMSVLSPFIAALTQMLK